MANTKAESVIEHQRWMNEQRILDRAKLKDYLRFNKSLFMVEGYGVIKHFVDVSFTELVYDFVFLDIKQ